MLRNTLASHHYFPQETEPMKHHAHYRVVSDEHPATNTNFVDASDADFEVDATDADFVVVATYAETDDVAGYVATHAVVNSYHDTWEIYDL